MEMMNITIKGYRNISNVVLSFDKISALVGLNGYGKSNIMDAIDFGISFISFPPALKSKIMSLKQNIPMLKSNAGQNFSFEMEAKVTSDGVDYIVKYGYEFSWSVNDKPAKIVSEFLKIKRAEKGSQYTTFINRANESCTYKSAETARCIKKIKISDDLLVLNKLSAIDDLFYSDIISQLNNMQFYIERHLDASQSYSPDPFVVKGFQELELDGIQNIPRAIYFLKKDYEDQYQLLVNAFKLLFPDILDINVDEIKLNAKPKVPISEEVPIVFTDSIYSMSVVDRKISQPMQFENLSDGTKRIFLMLTYAVIADIKGLSLLAIEEPENSIHPSLLQSYLDILCQLVNNCKIIITSHSPYIIKYLDPKDIYIGMPSASGESDFRRIAPTKEKTLLKDASKYDMSTGDYIFEILSSVQAEEFLGDYVEKKKE